MKRKPVKRNKLMTKEMKILIFATGIVDEFLVLLVFYFLYFIKGLDLEYVRTVVFAIISIDTVFTIFCYKNLKKNLWKINPFSNMYLNIACIFVIILCLSAIYLPSL